MRASPAAESRGRSKLRIIEAKMEIIIELIKDTCLFTAGIIFLELWREL